MSLFRRLMVVLGAGGAGYQSEYKEEANIFGIGHVCSSAPEKLTVTLTSLATLSVSELRLVVSPLSVIAILSYLATAYLTASPSSDYDLSTAVT